MSNALQSAGFAGRAVPVRSLGAAAPASPTERVLELGLIAKQVGTGVFVSGRPVEHVLAHTVPPALTDGTSVSIEVDVNTGAACARLATGEFRVARHCGDAGVVLLPVGARDVCFEPRSRRSPGARASRALDGLPVREPAAVLERALDVAFGTELEAHPGTAAMLVVHRGSVVAERYARGADAARPLESWSMGKSLLATLVGRAIATGWLELDAPAALEEWSEPGDPRAAITVRHLLQMSGGLQFTATWSPDWGDGRMPADHAYVYAGAIDAYAYATTRPLAHAPGTFGAYKNSDTLVLAAKLRRCAEARGLRFDEWVHDVLLAPLALDGVVLETDCYGNPFFCGNVLGTARDWARLCLLYLEQGRADGETLLTREFVEFVHKPAPGWRGRYWFGTPPRGWTDAIYGGHFWLNRYPARDAWPLPPDAYFMLGVGGQYGIIVPSLDCVIVRLGHVRAVLEREPSREPFASSLAQIMAALA